MGIIDFLRRRNDRKVHTFLSRPVLTIVNRERTGSAAEPGVQPLPKGQDGQLVVVKCIGEGSAGPIGNMVVVPDQNDKMEFADPSVNAFWMLTGDVAMFLYDGPTKTWYVVNKFRNS